MNAPEYTGARQTARTQVIQRRTCGRKGELA